MATDCPFILAQANNNPTVWIVLSFGIIALTYMYMRPRAKKDPLARSGPAPSLAQQRVVEREMSNLLVELSEMARTISASLDTRAAKLAALIDEADRKIAELQATAGNAKFESHPLGASEQPPAVQSDVLPAEPFVAASEHSSLTSSPSSAPISETISDEPDLRHAEIYSLSDQGRSAHEIAAALDRPRGEIELILALRPQVGSR